MDHAVGCFNVSFLYQSVFNGNEVTSFGQGQISAIDGFCVAIFDTGSHNLAGYYVKGQDCLELGRVLAQIIKGFGGYLGKRFVGRSKHGERTGALERVRQTSFDNEAVKGAELASAGDSVSN